jgi:copper chaperone CopZ
MKKTLFALALAMSASVITAATASPLPLTTMELDVTGLNCSLCSAEMKTKLKTIAGATDIEPRLECGKIYLDVPPGVQLNERGLSAALLSNGFTYEGAKPSKKSMSDVRKTAEDKC